MAFFIQIHDRQRDHERMPELKVLGEAESEREWESGSQLEWEWMWERESVSGSEPEWASVSDSQLESALAWVLMSAWG